MADGRPAGLTLTNWDLGGEPSAWAYLHAWLAERVTGLPFAEVLGREIWSAAGFEAPAPLCTSASGAPVSHGGLSVTLRDLARFGMLFTPSGRVVADTPVISEADRRRIRPRRDLYRRPESDAPPGEDGSVNLLRWFSRSLALSLA
jgi:CubicO group peptidase (beta-lactamase class C family)